MMVVMLVHRVEVISGGGPATCRGSNYRILSSGMSTGEAKPAARVSDG